MSCADGDHDARLTNLQASGAMYDPNVRDLKTLVRVAAQPLHLRQRHRIVSFINQVERFPSRRPFARITIERNRRATLAWDYTPRHLAHVDRLRRQLKKIQRANV